MIQILINCAIISDSIFCFVLYGRIVEKNIDIYLHTKPPVLNTGFKDFDVEVYIIIRFVLKRQKYLFKVEIPPHTTRISSLKEAFIIFF